MSAEAGEKLLLTSSIRHLLSSVCNCRDGTLEWLCKPKNITERETRMKRVSLQVVLACGAIAWLLPAQARAATGEGGAAHGLDPLALVGVAVMLVVAKLWGELFERLGQPAVLGELVAGI